MTNSPNSPNSPPGTPETDSQAQKRNLSRVDTGASPTVSKAVDEQSSAQKPKKKRFKQQDAKVIPFDLSSRSGHAESQLRESRTVNRFSSGNIGTSDVDYESGVKTEARRYAKIYTERNVAGVLNPALPQDAQQKNCVESVLLHVTERFEELIRSASGSGTSLEDSELSAVYVLTGTSSTAADGMTPSSISSEKVLYDAVRGIFRFVADTVANQYDANAKNLPRRPRKAVACKQDGFEPDDSYDSTRIGVGIYSARLTDEPREELNYADMILIVEAKMSDCGGNKDDVRVEALEQLCISTRNIYGKQPWRRFAWGMTVCCNKVHVYIFGQDRIFESPMIDLCASEDRGKLIRLLASWAFCPISVLGYDRTIGYMDTLKCRTFYVNGFDKVIYAVYTTRMPENLFGRHTVCYHARVMPDKAAEEVTKSDLDLQPPNLIVKDAWVCSERASEVDANDEIAFLKTINEAFAGDIGMAGKYPVLRAGCVVSYANGDVWDSSVEPTLDDTDTAFKMVGPDILGRIQYRRHKRIVIDGIAERLYNVNSVDELIVVLTDAMYAHTRIFRECGILQRDISPNNIMFTRGEGTITGMLIDFDCAAKAELTSRGPIQTGTGPFMSINNLRNSAVPRTPLDDWESLLYLICWMATFGVTTKHRNSFREAKDASTKAYQTSDIPINSWNGTFESAAVFKKDHMSSDEFTPNVIRHFMKRPGYDHLASLAAELREHIFDNPNMSEIGVGMTISRRTLSRYQRQGSDALADYYDKDVPLDISDPFERRAKCADKIVDDLLGIMKAAKVDALARMGSNSSVS